MCDLCPQHREELNLYMADLVDMANMFPGLGFYDYHREFSAKAASAVIRGLKVDLSTRDTSPFTKIFAGQKASTCNICKSVTHDTTFLAKS